jgi:putative flippase GtrA
MTQTADARDLDSERKGYGRYVRLAADLVKYGFASGAALALDYGLLIICYKLLGVNYLLAAAIGFVAGLGLVYLLSVRYVFSDRRRLRPGPELVGFLVTGLIGLLLNEALLSVFVETACMSVALAKIPTAGCVFMFNFTARRALLFSPTAPIETNASVAS